MPEKSDNPLREKARYLKGIGPRRADKLHRLGIDTVEDLLFHLPRDYEDRRIPTPIRNLELDTDALISGTIINVDLRSPRNPRKKILEVMVRDDSGTISLTWFNASRGWLQSFPEGKTITAYGKVRYYRGPQMVAPDYEVGSVPEESDKFGRILPLYPLTEGISQRLMRKFTRRALDEASSFITDVVPGTLRGRRELMSASEAIRKIHFPEETGDPEAARRRLAYGELLVFQCALAIQRRKVKAQTGYSFKVGPNVDERIRGLFPFTFTEAQDRVIGEIRADMRTSRPMNRLLQGDVGCGKTAVAVYAMLAALAESSRDRQVAMMAPTEVLAEQHFITLQSLLESANVNILLLSGASGSAEREQNLRAIKEGEADIVVGTHALIEQDVEFKNLALLVIDEQHRFGVRQRHRLQKKGTRPDVLIMTATPIPRTLALACFGDMDVSVIDEFPPEHRGVETVLLSKFRRKEAFVEALRELKGGNRVFVIYPLVEENEDLDLTSAKEGYEALRRGIFSDYSCALMHGRLPGEKKRQIMEGFRTGQYQVMIATTVVEVGIDVAEATIMIIQHAERLGLAQLHQLRGRVGRGDDPGKCYLLAEPTTEEAEHRLEVLTESSDGFEIAEADLRIRGPGELFGTEQSGMPEFRCYDFSDIQLLNTAREDAFAVVEKDPKLEHPENRRLRHRLISKYSGRIQFGGVG
ncbi:MAG: ATP-dependent DNA helicase RecG [Planctomycetota bacterium]